MGFILFVNHKTFQRLDTHIWPVFSNKTKYSFRCRIAMWYTYNMKHDLSKTTQRGGSIMKKMDLPMVLMFQAKI